MHELSLGQAFESAWDTFKRHWRFFVASFVALFLLNFLAGVTTPGKVNLFGVPSVVLGSGSLILRLVGIYITIGYTKVLLRAIDGEVPVASDFWSASLMTFLRYLGVAILGGLAVLAGTLALVLPGIWIGMRLLPSYFVVVDKDPGVTQTLSQSWIASKGHALKIFLAILVAILINIAGLCLLGVGVLASGPLSGLFGCALYRQLVPRSLEWCGSEMPQHSGRVS